MGRNIVKTKIYDSYEDFMSRPDEEDYYNGVSPEHAARNPNYYEDNKSNYGCWNCVGCTNCWFCESCTECNNCRDCAHCYKLTHSQFARYEIYGGLFYRKTSYAQHMPLHNIASPGAETLVKMTSQRFAELFVSLHATPRTPKTWAQLLGFIDTDNFVEART